MGRRLADELRARGVDPAGATVLAFGGNGATHCAGIAQAAGIGDVMTLPFSPVFSAYGASTADVRHRYEVRADQYDEQVLRARAERDMRGEGFAAGEIEVEVLRFQRDGTEWVALEATRELPHVDLARIAAADADVATEPVGSCEVRWPDVGVLATPVHSRERLRSGTELRGPALVDSATPTCAVPPGWTLLVDEHGAERLSFDGRRQA